MFYIVTICPIFQFLLEKIIFFDKKRKRDSKKTDFGIGIAPFLSNIQM